METKKVSDLKESPLNPRKISEDQSKVLAKTMVEYGDISGIVYNTVTKRLIGGHMRCRIFQKDWPIKITKKLKEPDQVGTIAEGYVDTPYGKWSYREVKWDEKKEVAAMIAANEAGGDFDYPKLKDLAVPFDDGEFDISLLGLTDDRLKAIIDYEPVDTKDIDDGPEEDDKSSKTVNPDIIVCPNCKHEFSVLKKKDEE